MQTQRGSILFYILLAVVLFGALSYAVASMLRGGGDSGAEDRAKIHAQAIMDYGQKLKIVIQDMKLQGVAVDQFSFLKPGDTGYATAPHTTKIFHPQGGGAPLLNVQGVYANNGASNNRIDVARVADMGLGTTAQELVFGINNVNKDVCLYLNTNLNNSATIPDESLEYLDMMDNASGRTVSPCVTCVNTMHHCFKDLPNDRYVFFYVLDVN